MEWEGGKQEAEPTKEPLQQYRRGLARSLPGCNTPWLGTQATKPLLQNLLYTETEIVKCKLKKKSKIKNVYFHTDAFVFCVPAFTPVTRQVRRNKNQKKNNRYWHGCRRLNRLFAGAPAYSISSPLAKTLP